MTGPQLAILPDPPPKLTSRQQAALDAIRDTPGGLTSQQLGQYLHARVYNHTCWACEDRGYWKRDGNQIGTALRRKGLLVHRGHTHWQALEGQTMVVPAGLGQDIPY